MIEHGISLASNGVVKVPGYEPLLRFGYAKNRSVYRLAVTASGEWEGLAIRCFWHVPDGKDPPSSLVVDGYVDVPASVTVQSGNGCITFEGSDGTVANMQNTNALQTQLANCCCENRQGQAQIQYDMATNTCAITNAIANQTQTIMQNDNANYRALHDEMVANRMADKDETIAQLRTQLSQMSLAASQQAQNNYLVSQLRPAPNPAYIVQNPNAAVGCNGLTGCCNMAS